MQISQLSQPGFDRLVMPSKMPVSILRLDRVHPLVSGNKWYKLKEYLKEAGQQKKKAIVTFGGAYSNHILATAAACGQAGFDSIGIIRGEQSPLLSPTLHHAMALGMKLVFISREQYQQKLIPPQVFEQYADDEVYFISEGGYGKQGMTGVSEMLHQFNDAGFTHIMAAVGTGTTLAGLVHATLPHQQVIGISALKNNFELEEQVRNLVPGCHNFKILHDYHFGGYAKYTGELLDFMNTWYNQTGIPSDFVYTGKLFFAFKKLADEGFFQMPAHVLLLHSGGLQGNQSLPPGKLIF